MRTRRGFARHFLLLGATFATGLVVGGAVVSVHIRRAPDAPVEWTSGRKMEPAAVKCRCTPCGRFEVRSGTCTARTVTLLRFISTYDPDSAMRWALQLHQLRGVTFTDCDFRGADLRGIDFTGCFFSWCDLSTARLEGANLTGVRYTSTTWWPAGFDPEAHGAQLGE